MQRLLLLGSFLASIAAGVACTRSALPVAGPGDVSRAATRWPGMSADALAHGRRLYQARCASCHAPVMPREVPEREWAGHVVEMQERAHLSDTEAELVTRYLVTMASTQAAK